MIGLIIALCIVVIILLVVLITSIRIVRQTEKVIVERAFYPYADQNVQNPGYKLTNTFADPDAYEIVNFFINDNVADQVDLMVSNVETRNVTAPGHSAETAPVVFTFHHLLTKINVKIKRSADFAQALNKKVIRITARLYGMKKKGNCVSGVWNTLPADVNPIGFTSSFENKDGLLTSAAAELQLWENGLMLVPQDVNGVKLEVEFVVEHWDTATPPKLTKTTTETQLMTLPTTVEWANAKQITYMAQIEANSNIVFLSPKVEPWVESSSSNSIVIK